MQKKLAKARNISIEDLKNFIGVGDQLNPGDLYFGNLKGAKSSLKKLTLFNDEFISSLNLAKPEPVRVKTADRTYFHKLFEAGQRKGRPASNSY